MKLIVRGRLLDETQVSDVVVEAGRVASVGQAGRGQAEIGGRNSIIAPTLFDIQVNGVMGMDLQSPALRIEDVRGIAGYLAGWGVSRFVPTVMTGAPAMMARSCRIIGQAIEQDREVARAVPGVHLEGPCISPEDGPRGAHDRKYVRKPDLRAFDKLYKAAGGRIVYTTVAPELPGAVDYIRALTARGVVVSLGHHNATGEQIARAVDAGARMCTHLGNGLASMIHRHSNPLWPQLADDRLAASFLADLQHLPVPMLKTFIRAKDPQNVVLASDSVHIAGQPPGRYMLGEMSVELLPSGRICLSGTGLLGGSSLMLLQGVVNAAQTGAMTLSEAFASASDVPARVLGLKRGSGMPEPGKRADFLVFRLEEGKAVPQASFVRGKLA
ncbi:MAG: amidohydrolase family protein [Candidatus Hydrogenedentes bacterium]|nr:amidohydrolase family protein [Candidatus Hydrogenedentota bacterium]